MLYAGDAEIHSKSAEGRAKMMAVIVTVFEASSRPHGFGKTDERPFCCKHGTLHPARLSSPKQLDSG